MGKPDTVYAELSRCISHALRHVPWLYELELDEEGWVPLEQLVDSLRSEQATWKNLNKAMVEEMIRVSPKLRHEIAEGRIRAIYGHSVPRRLTRLKSLPPEYLFHGTTPTTLEMIKKNGLKPMKRQNVHLSSDEATAIEVGKRKSITPVILRVQARIAFDCGIAFYEGNASVWLADSVPPRFIAF